VIRDIKERYSISDTYERFTGLAAKPKMVCPMPFHAHQDRPTPSFSIIRKSDGEFFTCHGNCGARGDVIDFVGYMTLGSMYNPHNPVDVIKAAQELGYRVPATLVYTPERPITPPKKTVNPCLGDILHANLRTFQPASDYIKHRGLDGLEETFIIGYKYDEWRRAHYISLPATFQGVTVEVKYRLIDTLYSSQERETLDRFTSEGGLATFNVDRAIYSDGLVVLVEAEICAARLFKYGITAIAPTAGAKSIDTRLKEWLVNANVVIVADNDPPGADGKRTGTEGALKRQATLGHGRIAYPPAEFKGLDDFLSAGGDPYQVILNE